MHSCCLFTLNKYVLNENHVKIKGMTGKIQRSPQLCWLHLIPCILLVFKFIPSRFTLVSNVKFSASHSMSSWYLIFCQNKDDTFKIYKALS